MATWNQIEEMNEREQQPDNKPYSDVDVLYNALKIYEENIYDILHKSNYLDDVKMEKAHSGCTAIAFKYLINHSENSTQDETLNDLINIAYQRFKLENEMKQRADVHAKPAESNSIFCEGTTTEPSCLNEKFKKKLYLIAKELLSTEETYVNTLHLIDQVFHKELLTAAVEKKIMPESDVSKIFCHISSIYQFHSTFLLPNLKERLQKWDCNPRIGDIMMKAAPFLKMYSSYVHCFEDSSKTINLWLKNSKEFSNILASIQAKEESRNITLQARMLEPVQRIPRYKMLLEQYIKYLPDDDEERPEAESALALIAEAASHSNETMKKIEKGLELVRKLSDLADVDFIMDASHELLKEGEATRIGDWDDKGDESYLYLLSDKLLDCVPLGLLQKKSYKVRTRIDLEDAKVFEVKNSNVTNSFCVHGIRKSVEFASATKEEKEGWICVIKAAIASLEEKKKSFERKLSSEDSEILKEESTYTYEMKDEHLGRRCPRWIKDYEATMCMLCSIPFITMLRPKHHCRACAKIVCGDCSDQKIILEYDSDSLQKVCGPCYYIICNRNKGLLDVDAYVLLRNSLLADFLHFSDNGEGKRWCNSWCIIPEDQMKIYVFKAQRDIRAEEMIEISHCEVSLVENKDHKYCLKVEHEKGIIFLVTDERERGQRWLYTLREFSCGRVPSKENIEENIKLESMMPSRVYE